MSDLDYEDLANAQLAQLMRDRAANAVAGGYEDVGALFQEVASRLRIVQGTIEPLADHSLSDKERREVARRAYRNDPVFSMAVDMVARELVEHRRAGADPVEGALCETCDVEDDLDANDATVKVAMCEECFDRLVPTESEARCWSCEHPVSSGAETCGWCGVKHPADAGEEG